MGKSTNCMVAAILCLSSFGVVSCFDRFTDGEPEHVGFPAIRVDSNQNSDSDSALKILSMVSERYRSIQALEVFGTNRYQSSRRLIDVDTSFDFEISYASKQTLKILWQEDGEAFSFSSNVSGSVLKVNDKTTSEYDDPFWGLLNAASKSGRDRFEIGRILMAKERSSGELQGFKILSEITMEVEESIGENPCHLIQARYTSDPTITVKYWVDKQSYLILQYQRQIPSRNDEGRFSISTERYFYKSLIP